MKVDFFLKNYLGQASIVCGRYSQGSPLWYRGNSVCVWHFKYGVQYSTKVSANKNENLSDELKTKYSCKLFVFVLFFYFYTICPITY